MNIPHRKISVDINRLNFLTVDLIGHINDENTRYLDLSFTVDDEIIELEQGCTASVTYAAEGFLLAQDVECEIDDNALIIGFDNEKIENARSGILEIQPKVVDSSGNVLTLQVPVYVRISADLAQIRKVDGKSEGSYAEVVHEISEARGSYDKLKDRLDHTGAPTDEQVAEAVSDYLDEHPTVLSYVTPQKFGAKADGKTDDTEAIIQAIESANTVYFPEGVYKVHGSPITDSSAGIVIPSNRTIIMDDNAVILKSETKLLENILITAVNAENITIRGGTIRGDRLYKQQNLTAAEYVTYSHNSSGILVQAGKNIKIENVHIDSIAGDGIMLLNSENDICENIYLNNCVVEKSHRSNLWIAGAKNIYIKNCNFNYGGYRFDENGDTIIRDDFLDGASQSVIDNLTSRQIYSVVEIDGVEHIQINGTNPRAGINLEHASGEKIYISDSHFEGNDANDIVINSTYDELYISNCDFSSRITSVRNTATDKIVFSGSKINHILIHGEKLLNCIVTGEALITRAGSKLEFCEINKLSAVCETEGENVQRISNCFIKNVNIALTDKSTFYFENCDFNFSKGSIMFFCGKKAVLLNCNVLFNADYDSTVTPFYNIKELRAKNTVFEMPENDIPHSVEGLFKTISLSVGFISLENCVFDINPYIGRILHQQTHSAVAVNNTVINHTSLGSFSENPENYVIHGNVFKNKPAKISDFENDSDYVNTTSMNQAIQTAIGGIENGSY